MKKLLLKYLAPDYATLKSDIKKLEEENKSLNNDIYTLIDKENTTEGINLKLKYKINIGMVKSIMAFEPTLNKFKGFH